MQAVCIPPSSGPSDFTSTNLSTLSSLRICNETLPPVVTQGSAVAIVALVAPSDAATVPSPAGRGCGGGGQLSESPQLPPLGDLKSLPNDALQHCAQTARQNLAGCERQLAGCLIEIERRGLHLLWGASSIVHYAALALEMDAHTAREMMRTARALEALPRLAELYYDGGASRWKVKEITRVATPETDAFWAAQVRIRNARQIANMVRRTPKGGRPDEARPAAQTSAYVRTRIVLDLEPEQAALVSDALDRVYREAGGRVALAEAFEIMAQEFLNTAYREEDLSNRYQVVVHCDPQAQDVWMETRQGPLAVAEETLEQALCDAQVVDLRKVVEQAEPSRAGRDGPSVPACSDTGATDSEAERVDGDSKVASAWPLLEQVTRSLKPRAWAPQARTVPPAAARHVMVRDAYSCCVPGCGMRIWKEIHHLQWRSEGGSHCVDNLLLVCSRHHKMLHRGLLSAEGTSAQHVVWRDKMGRVLLGSASAE